MGFTDSTRYQYVLVFPHELLSTEVNHHQTLGTYLHNEQYLEKNVNNLYNSIKITINSPSINIAGAKLSLVFVIPRTCQGSTDPWTKTTLVTSISRPPYSTFVLSTALSRNFSVYLSSKMSAHCWMLKFNGNLLLNTWGI